MKCVCGFKQKPDNVIVLKKHIEDCMLTGPLKDVYPDPVVVWRNHEFTVTTQVEEDEAIMDIGFVRPEISRVNIENKIAVQETIVQNAVQNLETPEEIIEAIQDVVLQGETAEAVEEKPAPKKRAPAKKKASGAK
jgi:hypothetical protein